MGLHRKGERRLLSLIGIQPDNNPERELLGLPISVSEAKLSQLTLGDVCCALPWVAVLRLPLVRWMGIRRFNRDDMPMSTQPRGHLFPS